MLGLFNVPSATVVVKSSLPAWVASLSPTATAIAAVAGVFGAGFVGALGVRVANSTGDYVAARVRRPGISDVFASEIPAPVIVAAAPVAAPAPAP